MATPCKHRAFFYTGQPKNAITSSAHSAWAFIKCQLFLWSLFAYFVLCAAQNLESTATILNATKSSCVAVFDSSVPDEFISTIEKAYTQETRVSIVKRPLKFFTWPSGEKLTFYQEVPEYIQLIMFPQQKQASNCLMPVPYRIMPKARAYSGDLVIENTIDFVNIVCDTYRSMNGQLDMKGLHRDYILDNVFNVSAGQNQQSIEEIFGHAVENLSATNVCQDDRAYTNSSAFKKTNILTKLQNRWAQYKNVPSCNEIFEQTDLVTLFNDYIVRSQPVVIRKPREMAEWVASKLWSKKFFKSNFGKNMIHVKLAPNGIFEGVESAHLWNNFDTFSIPAAVKEKLFYPDLVVVRPASQNMNVSNFFDLVDKSADTNVSVYIEYSSIRQYMPEVESHVEEFSFIRDLLTLRQLNMWLSNGDTLGKLHFDPFDNFLCQLRGKKQVLMFDPSDNRRLYEAHIPEAVLKYDMRSGRFIRDRLVDSTSMVMSPVDVLRPQFDRFPGFKSAVPLKCEIDEGDVLYLPSFWWHEVQSFPSPDHLNLAVNFWYEPFLTKDFPCAECQLDVNPHYRHLL